MKKDVVIIGAGPAGLSAAIEAARAGASVLVADLNMKAGGQLFKQIHKFFGSESHHSGTRGIDIGEELLAVAKENGVEIWLQSTVIDVTSERRVSIERRLPDGSTRLVAVDTPTVIIAAGASENAARFRGWTIPGVMGAGAAQTMVNVNHVKPGNRIVMLGSGNVGLIVSYQLLQAGCDVIALVEAGPKIGGYAVHAAKLCRAGVPIYTRHTIVEALAGADQCLEKVVIASVDDDFEPIPGTERVLEADCIALAVGLKPSVELPSVAACALTYQHVFGGFVPLHNEKMETSVPGIFVAGDVTGVEEANTAMEEGRLAGISAAETAGYLTPEEAAAKRELIWKQLADLRMGPFGEKRQRHKQAILNEYQSHRKEVQRRGL